MQHRVCQKINQQGPDLTNQTVGTLIRFRQERIAFVADIDMFFQVLVSNNHWNLLCFLWWQDGNLRKEPVNHKICVHVFGDTSLPFAKTFQNNFYVDDLLNSVAREDQADKKCQGYVFISRFYSDKVP